MLLYTRIKLNTRYHSQAVRQRSAKPLCAGAIPAGTSILFIVTYFFMENRYYKLPVVTLFTVTLLATAFFSGCGQTQNQSSMQTNPSNQETWPQFSFTPESGSSLFTLRMPDLPSPLYSEIPTTLSDKSTVTLYQSVAHDASNHEFKLTHLTYPATFVSQTTPEKMVGDQLTALTNALPGSTLVSSSKTTFNGNPATDFVLNSNNSLLHGRIIFVGAQNTLYTLSLLAPKDTDVSQDLTHFLNSLELK